jgi:hypothetical protein
MGTTTARSSRSYPGRIRFAGLGRSTLHYRALTPSYWLHTREFCAALVALSVVTFPVSHRHGNRNRATVNPVRRIGRDAPHAAPRAGTTGQDRQPPVTPATTDGTPAGGYLPQVSGRPQHAGNSLAMVASLRQQRRVNGAGAEKHTRPSGEHVKVAPTRRNRATNDMASAVTVRPLPRP